MTETERAQFEKLCMSLSECMKAARSVGVDEDAIKDHVGSMIATLCGKQNRQPFPTFKASTKLLSRPSKQR